MNEFKNIIKLLKPGLMPILPTKLRRFWHWTLMLSAIVFFIFAEIFDIVISPTLSNLSLPALSIFTALIFTAIFTVPSQLSQKIKDYENDDDEPTVNFLISYRNFIQSFSRQLISLVLLSIIIIGLILLNDIFEISLVKHAIFAIILPLAFCFLAVLISVVRNISRMIEENISFSTEKIKEKKRDLE